MSETVDLDAKRKAKQPRCHLCGEAVHDWIGQCHRVTAITEETDGSITYHLSGQDDPPDAA
jgi:predicted ATP-dependent serine protease